MKKKFICINTILCLILSIFLSESKANSKSWIYSAISQVKNIVLLSENETNTIPEKYDLRDDIEISVKNQYHSGICSDCATASQYETHIKLRQKHGEYDFFNKTPIFSVLGSTKIGAVSGVYTNGEPFSIAPISIDDSEKFLQEEYDKEYTEDDFLRNVKGDYRERNVESELKEKIFGIEQNFKITKKIHPEHLYKTYGEDGALTYKDEKGNILDKGMVTSIRNKYKKYIS